MRRNFNVLAAVIATSMAEVASAGTVSFDFTSLNNGNSSSYTLTQGGVQLTISGQVKNGAGSWVASNVYVSTTSGTKRLGVGDNNIENGSSRSERLVFSLSPSVEVESFSVRNFTNSDALITAGALSGSGPSFTESNVQQFSTANTNNSTLVTLAFNPSFTTASFFAGAYAATGRQTSFQVSGFELTTAASPVTLVPLPAAAWAGLALMSCVGGARKARA